MRRYAAHAEVLTDDRMTLEFSGPRELRGRGIGENGAALRALLGPGDGPPVIRQARAAATADDWQRRARMMVARDAHTVAYEDYLQALRLDARNREALEGFVRAAVLTRRGHDALGWLKTLAEGDPSPEILVATSKLLASIGARADALEAAKRASNAPGDNSIGLEQLASLHADNGDVTELEQTVRAMQAVMPSRAATAYYAAVAAFLRGRAEDALRLAEEATVRDRTYAAVYDLTGAAYARLGRRENARQAFLTSLQFDAHDSTAYANLGVLALGGGDAAAAADYFAEALWLDENSALARDGLARALRGSRVQ